MEQWKDVKGFEGLYKISNTGKIKSLGRISENKGNYKGFITVKEKELKQTINRLGYHVITLFKDKKRYFKIIHRLVAESFIENNNKYKEVNHKDLNKSNNHVSNLEWCNRSYNINHFLKSKNTTSKYRGVSYQIDRKKWVSYIDLNNKRLMLGRFENEEEAKKYRENFINQLKTINYEELI